MPAWSLGLKDLLENPLDTGTWRATVHRVAKGWSWLKWLSTRVHGVIAYFDFIRLITNKVEFLFIILLSTWVPSSLKCLKVSYPFCYIGFLFLLNLKEFFIHSVSKPFVSYMHCKYFSHCAVLRTFNHLWSFFKAFKFKIISDLQKWCTTPKNSHKSFTDYINVDMYIFKHFLFFWTVWE